MSHLVLDISEWQQDFNYAKFKADNPDVKGVILRSSYTGSNDGVTKKVDARFEEHYQGFKRVGLPMGVYHYSRANTIAKGLAEAQYVMSLIYGKQIDYPIYIDVEDSYYQEKANKKDLTDAVIAFCDHIEVMGYYAGIYANAFWFNHMLDWKRLEPYDKWVAHYGVKMPDVPFKTWNMHQYTSSYTTPGYNGKLDMSFCYKDYPVIMRAHGLNGYKKEEPQPPLNWQDHVLGDLTYLRSLLDKVVEDVEKGYIK